MELKTLFLETVPFTPGMQIIVQVILVIGGIVRTVLHIMQKRVTSGLSLRLIVKLVIRNTLEFYSLLVILSLLFFLS